MRIFLTRYCQMSFQIGCVNLYSQSSISELYFWTSSTNIWYCQASNFVLLCKLWNVSWSTAPGCFLSAQVCQGPLRRTLKILMKLEPQELAAIEQCSARQPRTGWNAAEAQSRSSRAAEVIRRQGRTQGAWTWKKQEGGSTAGMSSRPIVKSSLIALTFLTRKGLVELSSIPVLNSFYRWQNWGLEKCGQLA